MQPGAGAARLGAGAAQPGAGAAQLGAGASRLGEGAARLGAGAAQLGAGAAPRVAAAAPDRASPSPIDAGAAAPTGAGPFPGIAALALRRASPFPAGIECSPLGCEPFPCRRAVRPAASGSRSPRRRVGAFPPGAMASLAGAGASLQSAVAYFQGETRPGRAGASPREGEPPRRGGCRNEASGTKIRVPTDRHSLLRTSAAAAGPPCGR